ncbi:MAG: shikimate kinase [Candidatus Gastranaerophilales bacterium]|nr:shikimate kinase [Candidatus Gastranaerophilales bacterium]
MDANIVLTGLMGAGKSTVGKTLAQKLPDFVFVDIDEEIEKSEKMSVSEIFKTKSEEYFRELETKTIKHISSQKNMIISVGGGAFESEVNRQNLTKNGIVFYLYAPTSILFERIKNNSNRPLLKCNNPLSKLEELLKKRENNYKKSHYTIDTTNKTKEEITEEILRKL